MRAVLVRVDVGWFELIERAGRKLFEVPTETDDFGAPDPARLVSKLGVEGTDVGVDAPHARRPSSSTASIAVANFRHAVPAWRNQVRPSAVRE